MRRAKALIGLPVIAHDRARVVGEVKDLCVDPAHRQVHALVVVDGAVWRRTRFLPWDRIQSIGEDAVYIPSQNVLVTSDTSVGGCWHLMAAEGGVYGRSIVDIAGERLGRLGDLLIDLSTGEIAGYELSDGMVQDMLTGRQRLLAQSHLSPDGESLVIEACRLPDDEP